MFNEVIRTLYGVRHAPELKRNLIFLGMLDNFKYSFNSNNREICVTKEGSVVMEGEKKIRLYVLIGSSIPANAVMTVESDVDKTKIWHIRLGHMSVKELQELEKQRLLGGDKISSLEFCENYVFRKAHRAKFPKGVHRSKCVLEYVHSDLWRPAQVSSLSRGKYFMTLIDYYSRNVRLYILKTKD